MVDWDNVPKSEIADVCGRDPLMWAEAFCHTAKKIGVDLGHDPEGWLVGWFSAAMQAETDHMTPEQHEHEAREQRRVKCLHQMGDIVERLKQLGSDMGEVDRETCNEAADEIERLRGVEQDAVEWVEERTKRLRADNERLRAALREIASTPTCPGAERERLIHVARTALEQKT